MGRVWSLCVEGSRSLLRLVALSFLRRDFQFVGGIWGPFPSPPENLCRVQMGRERREAGLGIGVSESCWEERVPHTPTHPEAQLTPTGSPGPASFSCSCSTMSARVAFLGGGSRKTQWNWGHPLPGTSLVLAGGASTS